MTDTDELTQAAKEAFRNEFGAILEIRIKDVATLYVDGRRAPPRVSAERPKDAPENADADAAPAGYAVWAASENTLREIFARKKALQSSYLSGRLSIGGDMSVMTRLQLEAKQS